MEMICIVCPKGCRITAEPGDPPAISGNGCKRGYQFALDELTDPRRTVCTTVKTAFPEAPVLPVRLTAGIPKNRIFDVMRAIAAVTVTEPLGIGEPVIRNVLGLGADVIASANILKEIYGEVTE
jgi:CxxC motif-containing protein